MYIIMCMKKHVILSRATSRHEPSSRKDEKSSRKKHDHEEDEATYKDSNIFMKVNFVLFVFTIPHYPPSSLSLPLLQGTQSANPHNDYSQHFVDTWQRPHNFIRDVGIGERFREYPKLNELMRLKVAL